MAQTEQIVFKNLVAPYNGGVIGSDEPLRIKSAPCFASSNAKGNLRSVESLDEVRSIAKTSTEALLRIAKEI